MSVIKSYLGVRMIKKALPLRKPLDLIDEKALAPYIVVQKQKIENQDMIEALGTEDYIQWVLENTEAEVGYSLRGENTGRLGDARRRRRREGRDRRLFGTVHCLLRTTRATPTAFLMYLRSAFLGQVTSVLRRRT